MAVDSTELAQVIAEAADIAQSVGHKLTTAHLLLAVFTVPNRGQVLLKERNIDEDVLLNAMTRAPKEPDGMARELLDRAREIAQGCGSEETDCAHLLIATTRMRDCAAIDLLQRSGVELASLRNTALSYYLGGRMPRRMRQIDRQPVSVAPLSRPPRPTARATPPRRPAEARPAVPEAPEPPPPAPAPRARMETILPDPIIEPPPPPPSQEPLSKFALDEKEFPWLTSLGRNLTEMASRGQIDPVVGRAQEIEEVIDILGKRRTNNPCLIGEPGVGKTSVVEGVAQRLLELSERGLEERIIIELDMASVVAGTQLRGSFSEKLNGIKDEVKRAGGKVVVFIDEIHTVIGAGSTGEGPQDAANELKAALARGEFPCIGATTHDEYRKFIQQDPALERRFTPVLINEPTIAETVVILEGIADRYSEHHKVRFTPESLQAAAALAARFVSDRFLPDKAVSVIDLAGSRARREGLTEVGATEVARIVSRLAGIPEERLLLQDQERLLQLEKELSRRVIGHEQAVERVARVVRRNYAGFASRRPMGSFLFLGPTGVGKTEFARAMADVLFGGRDALIRVDMSECAEQHGVARLVGAPPGYVGYGDSGQLTEPVRRRPSSVVLLDEVEKAHRDVLLLLLQVLEEGRLTDGRGRHIDFSNTVVILTTNLGAEAFAKGSAPVGFGTRANPQGETDRALEAARRQLPPELWNRLDERLVFRPLQTSEVSRIARLLLDESAGRLSREKGITYRVDADVIEHLLANGGYDPLLGARPMRQAIQRLVEAPLADAILEGRFGPGDEVLVRTGSGGITFSRA